MGAVIQTAVLWIASFVGTATTAADVARCESSHRFADAAVVLEVGRNRARLRGTTLLHELTRPRQFARGCPAAPRTWSPRHLVLGFQAALGRLDVPGWAREAVFYCSGRDRPACVARGSALVGRVEHEFWGPARRRR